MSESTSPLTNGKVIGKDVHRGDYILNTARRGEPEFVMSRGELVEFNICPWRWVKGYREEQNSGMAWGSLIDCLVLTPAHFDTSYAVTPENYTNEKGETKPWNWNASICKQWREENEAREAVKHDEYQRAKAAVSVLMEDEHVSSIIHHSDRQVMVCAQYTDKETGITVPLKTLVDSVPAKDGEFRKSLVDLKTAANAMPRTWGRVVVDRGYHVQAALYLDCYVAATGEDRVEFRHIVQESFEPFAVGKRLIGQEFIELGRMQYLAALKRYCQCLKANHWPGFDEEERETVRGWSITQPESWMVGR